MGEGVFLRFWAGGFGDMVLRGFRAWDLGLRISGLGFLA